MRRLVRYGLTEALTSVSRPSGWVLAGLVSACALGCSTPDAGPGQPAPRGAAAATGANIDETKLVTLHGNTHPSATAETDRGPVEDGFVLSHMQLVLTRGADREARLEAFIDALHDPTSPLYHQWLTAEQFRDQWGVPETDVTNVIAWLTSHGFAVGSVPTSRMFLEFTGTARQIRETFHTEIHRLEVNGVQHFGNMSDPAIPAALTGVVAGVHALHDFMPHSMRKDHGAVRRNAATGAWRDATPHVKASPDLTTPYGTQCEENSDCASGTCNLASGICACSMSTQCSATLSGAAASCDTATQTCVQCQTNADCIGPSTCNTATNICEETYYAVTPADFATIYNLNPLFAENINGAGQTVVVIEDSLLTNPSDIAAFRAAFGLSGGSFGQITATGTTTCNDSGVNSAEGEAAIDAEWAGASAPGANIVLASCADTTTVFGGLIALQNLINGTTPPPIVSISYGECEAQNGAAANASYVSTYQQAVAEGTSVFVSAGDEGAAECDANKTVATHGIAVTGFGSTPYNVAVGGTDFMDYYDTQQGGPAASTYWNASNTGTFGSALSYIPEIPWNNSCASRLIYSTTSMALGTYTEGYGATGFCNSTVGKAEFRNVAGGSGGPSSYSAQPSWQTGVVGLPTKSGGPRYLPDVSLFAANGVFGHFLVYCLTDTAQGGGPCTYANPADMLALAAGGTSFASPAMAGIQALINQKMGNLQGNPNYTYYRFAGVEQGARGSARCNSSGGTPASPVPPTPGCIFNDITQGDMAVNCANTRTSTGPNCFGQSGSGNTAIDGVLSTSTTALAPAYAAGTGWDFATGLGSVNAYNLVTAWSN